MQGIKGVKFQEDKTVLTSMLKGKYLSSITGLKHLDNRIPVKSTNPCLVISGYPLPGTLCILITFS